MSLFRRSAWDRVGGYASMSWGEDLEIDEKLRDGATFVSDPQPDGEAPPRNEWSYIYRWGVSQLHISSQGPPLDGYKCMGERPIESGSFVLRPRWRRDYDLATRLLATDPALFSAQGLDTRG
jgi:hypothetical protein